ncbi:unnamed protein product [Trichogramma brassicae]|uniref:Uncharacterized protein n=1 Tax=Trichogramma brassicae TaxID=86971 RepID=A0A6H5IYX3_9HYME|nr:unnamed protein product [Trichogramma brassicae]
MELFFQNCDDVNQSVQVDARDKLGRTPLQLAVASLLPDCIDILYERGSEDLSDFIFPTDSYFAERYKSLKPHISSNGRLRLASGAFAAVEKIVKRGYQLQRSDAMTIMKFFAEYELFEKSSDLEKCWYDDEDFITRANAMLICPGLSRIPNIILDIEEMLEYDGPCLTLDELVRLRPEDAEKLLTYEDYWKFACSNRRRIPRLELAILIREELRMRKQNREYDTK